MERIEILKKLYLKKSKHSNYQILSNKLSHLMSIDNMHIKSRYEKERLNFILNNIDVKGKSILDIGGNTGFFSFELLDKGAKHVHYVDGNKEHAEFVRLAAEILEIQEKITVSEEYYQFTNNIVTKYDVSLLLNVLHHVGDDYGLSKLTVNEAKDQIIKQLLSLHNSVNYIVFQLGFNWKGDINKRLFNKGTKKELIEFISKGVKNIFNIESIGVAVRKERNIFFESLNKNNIRRDDSLGEFLNRPLFILRSI